MNNETPSEHATRAAASIYQDVNTNDAKLFLRQASDIIAREAIAPAVAELVAVTDEVLRGSHCWCDPFGGDECSHCRLSALLEKWDTEELIIDSTNVPVNA